MQKRWLVLLIALVASPVFAGTIVIRKTTFPAGGTGFSFNESVTSGSFLLNDGGSQTFVSVTAGTYTITEADPAVTPGGWTLADLSCDDSDSVGDVAARTATVNVGASETVTCTFRNLETAPTDQIFVFHLEGSQEVPAVPTASRGGCMARFDAGSSDLSFVCTHDVAGPIAMHVHRGAPGINGAIIFDFGSSASPVVATWSGMAPADVADLLAGSLYVNIHTVAFPGGFIRGQILPRTVDTVAFAMTGSQVVPPSGSAATGNCTADLDTNATALALTCTHDVPSPTDAHVHDAPAGADGPIVFTIPSAASPIATNVPLTPRFVADFAAGFLYADVHAGAPVIRGQIAAATSNLGIAKTGPATAVAGSNISYNLSATNAGPGDATSVTITDAVPAGTTFVSVTQNSGPAFTCDTTVVCSIGTFPAAATASFTIVVATAPSATLPVTNTASIATTSADLDSSNDSSSVITTLTPPSTDLGVTKSAGAGPFVTGGAAQFTITVSNLGSMTADGATVTDTLPAGMTLVSATPSQGSCSGTTTVTCALGTIAAAGSATVVLNVTLPATPGPVTNTAAVSMTTIDTNPANDSGTATITVDPPLGAIPTLSPLILGLLVLTMAAIALRRT